MSGSSNVPLSLAGSEKQEQERERHTEGLNIYRWVILSMTSGTVESTS